MSAATSMPEACELPRLDVALGLADLNLKVAWAYGVVLDDAGTPTGCECRSPKCERRSWGKHPIANAWQRLASDEPQVLRDQFSRLRFVPNIGLVMGAQSDGRYLVAVDVDDADRMAALVAEYGPLPPTMTGRSPRGLRHVYSIPSDVPRERLRNKAGIRLPTDASDVPGVDVKREGGFVVVVGRNAGGVYAWDDPVLPIAELPASWVLPMLAPLAPPPEASTYTPHSLRADKRAAKRLTKYLEAAVNGEAALLARCVNGTRNTTLNASAFKLFSLASGMPVDGGRDLVRSALQSAGEASGLRADEVRSTIESAEKGAEAKNASRAPSPVSTRAAPSSSTRPVALDDKRITIVISPDIECNADDAIAALARDHRTYQRSGELVHVTQSASADPAKAERAPLAQGSPVIHTMAIATLLERAASAARWTKVNAEGEERHVLPPSAVVSAVHARGQYREIRELAGVAESPLMRPNGTLVQTPGYDAATGYLYAPNASFPIVPERPTQEQAREALSTLTDLFCDFPFVDAASRMVPIAAQLTLQVRPAILGPVPAFAFDAATRGSGKGLGGSIPVEIHTGRPPALATFPGGRNGQEELEKMLGAYALSGAPVVFFDNVPIGTPFGGAPLEKCLTAPDKVSLRRLGQSETPELPWKAVVIVSGNNLTIADETARRVLLARIVSPLERPEERTGFKYPELLQHVRAKRPELVAAGLTIVRAYVAAGSPDTGTMSLGSFEAWSRLIPRAIVWAGGADVMGARVTVTGAPDEASATLATILDRLPRLLYGHEGGLSANAILDALYPGPGPHEPPDGWGELRGALESATTARTGVRPDAARLGTYFRGHRDRKIEGKALVVLGTHARANRWGVR